MIIVTSDYQSRRPIWSRFFSPSFTEKGKDKDTQFYMQQFLNNYGQLSQPANAIYYNLSELKRYFNQLNQPQINQYIQQVPYNNFSKLRDFMNQLPALAQYIEKQVADNRQRYSIINTLQDFGDYVTPHMNLIHDRLNDMGRTMERLRSQRPVVGRGYGPSAGMSPLNEFAQLENAVMKMQQNPLNPELRQSVQLAYAKFHDRLRSVPTSSAGSESPWTQSAEGQDEFLSPFQPTDNPSSAQQTQTQPTSTNISVGSPVETAASLLHQLLTPEQLTEVVNALKNVSLSDKPGDYTNLNSLISRLRSPQQATTLPSNPEQQSPNMSQQVASNVADTPKETLSNTSNISVTSGRQRGGQLSHADRMASDWSNLAETQADYDDEEGTSHAALVKGVLNKIAQVMQEDNSEIANIIEEIVSNVDDYQEIQFPQIAKIN